MPGPIAQDTCRVYAAGLERSAYDLPKELQGAVDDMLDSLDCEHVRHVRPTWSGDAVSGICEAATRITAANGATDEAVQYTETIAERFGCLPPHFNQVDVDDALLDVDALTADVAAAEGACEAGPTAAAAEEICELEECHYAEEAFDL
eukprot:tig00001600_g9387.t1